MNKPDAEKIPDWKLERFLLGELPAAEMRRIKRQVADNPALAEALQALETQYRELLAAHPPGPMAAGIASRMQGSPAPGPDRARFLPRGRFFWVPATGIGKAGVAGFLALLVLLVLPVLLFRGGLPGGKAAWDDGRIKGSQPEIFLYRKVSGGTEQLRSGQKVHAGDLVQVYYDAAGISQGLVFSVDASGRVTWHLPERGNRQSAPLKTGGKTPLAFSFELDDSGWEEFFFIASDKPFSLDSLFPGGAPPFRGQLPKGFYRSTFTLVKEPKT